MRHPRNGWASIKKTSLFPFFPSAYTHFLTLSLIISWFLHFLTPPPRSLSLHPSTLSFLSQRLTCYQHSGDLTAERKKQQPNVSQAWPRDVSQCHLSISLWSHINIHTVPPHHYHHHLPTPHTDVQMSSLAVTQSGPVKSRWGGGCVGMKSQEWGTGFRPFTQTAYTLMSKSSLCVAMGTRATLTKESKRARDAGRREERK